MAWISLFDLITGRYGLSEVSGPIGIINYVADAASASSSSMDWTPLLTIMALIAINVGLFNQTVLYVYRAYHPQPYPAEV